jgi:hypothetical protein
MTNHQMSQQEEFTINQKFHFMDPYEEIESFDLVLDKNIHHKYCFKKSPSKEEAKQSTPIYHLPIYEY